MTEKADAKEAAETLGCAALAAFFAAAMVCCVAVGMALGAEWGVAGAALVIAALGVLMAASAKIAKRKMREDDSR